MAENEAQFMNRLQRGLDIDILLQKLPVDGKSIVGVAWYGNYRNIKIDQ
ncbi:hypothetical protein [Neisseria iguanae]|nr:hypothetical protein [Neisseria iguanae]